jgi:hypothetical protein
VLPLSKAGRKITVPLDCCHAHRLSKRIELPLSVALPQQAVRRLYGMVGRSAVFASMCAIHHLHVSLLNQL